MMMVCDTACRDVCSDEMIGRQLVGGTEMEAGGGPASQEALYVHRPEKATDRERTTGLG
jgi:hypothetical protein